MNSATDKKPKICVYAISKNEEQFVERFCKSASDADLVLIADTGSTDKTIELAKQHGARVHDICISPWRFDHARNAALALIPKDIDICVSLDLDEVLEPGWREAIEAAWVDGVTRLRYLYDWGLGIVFYYEKIHARHGYHWHHPCHEYPRADGRITEKFGTVDKLLVVHHADHTKSRGQYLDLLELSVKEGVLATQRRRKPPITAPALKRRTSVNRGCAWRICITTPDSGNSAMQPPCAHCRSPIVTRITRRTRLCGGSSRMIWRPLQLGTLG